MNASCSRAIQARAYNLGSGHDFSIEEALHELIEVSQIDVEIEIDPEKLRPR